MEFDDWYWLVWLGVIFLAYELYAALSKKKGDTLSENVWDWFAIRDPNARLGRLRRLILMGFWTALGSHFLWATPVAWVILFSVGMVWSIVFHYRYER